MTSSPRDWRRLGLDTGGGLDLRDGRTLKARVFTSPRWAADVERLLAAPAARACPRPIERHGNVLISEFVPGISLDERLATATGSEARHWARDAGRLMAGMHRGRPPRGRGTAPAWYQRHLISGLSAHQ